jgi:hypothetical protein
MQTLIYCSIFRFIFLEKFYLIKSEFQEALKKIVQRDLNTIIEESLAFGSFTHYYTL